MKRGRFLNNFKRVVFHGATQMVATFVLGSVAFVLFLLALSLGGIPLFAQNKSLFATIAYVLIGTLILSFAIFRLYNNPTVCKLIALTLLILAISSFLYYILCKSGLIFKINSFQAIKAYIQSFGSLSVFLFVVFQFLQVVVLPVPGAVSVAAGVALFGAFPCAVYSMIGILLGSLVSFFLGRVLGVRAVEWLVGKQTLQKWMDKIKGKDYLLLSLMFLLPLFPDDILCFVAGLSSMSWLYFIIMIFITRLISIFTTAYSFRFIPFNTWWGLTIWAILLIAVALAFYFVNKYGGAIDTFIKTKLANRKHKMQKNKKVS
jgi:uncharacterized membrane protein YdjX (TVP38/TMEM64 family)